MFYPIWQPLPRPPFFPEDPELERLLNSNYDPALGQFKVRMKRRHARDLRKGLFGPQGLRKVPDNSGGMMVFDLPNGWTLRLTYYAAGEYDVDRRRMKAGDVDAKFIPPTMHQRPRVPAQDGQSGAEEAHPA
jgi:hypothetical protein